MVKPEIYNEPERRENMLPNIEIHKVCDGLGYGAGPISGAEIRAAAGAEIVQAAELIINSLAILTPIGKDEDDKFIRDDGCGDGRKVGRIFVGMDQKHRSLNRAKVFGGGAAMATAVEIGLGHAGGLSLQQMFSSGIAKLKNKKLNFGAHTADHMANPASDSGCGAIDNAPKIIAAAVEYAPQIQDSVEALNLNDQGLDNVLSNFAAYNEEIDGQPYSGKKVVDEVGRDKVVKELVGKHLEGYIILNYVHGHTVNQDAVRQATGGKIQVFAVDLWRLEDYARRLPDEPGNQNQTFLAEIVYTLATASVLTKGDLPVYIVQSAEVLSSNTAALLSVNTVKE